MVALMFNFTFGDEKAELIISSSYLAFLYQLMSWMSLSLWASFSERGLLTES